METKYESNNNDIINNCLAIISKPKRLIKDSHSQGYLKARNRIDELRERELLASQIDDENYYEELSKDFNIN